MGNKTVLHETVVMAAQSECAKSHSAGRCTRVKFTVPALWLAKLSHTRQKARQQRPAVALGGADSGTTEREGEGCCRKPRGAKSPARYVQDSWTYVWGWEEALNEAHRAGWLPWKGEVGMRAQGHGVGLAAPRLLLSWTARGTSATPQSQPITGGVREGARYNSLTP